ncbi:MAG: response regulator transcription factor [Erysipelotrichaceae bacterium]|nr:response regulator transcription factor [Erysipelotrichaceae bacterium]
MANILICDDEIDIVNALKIYLNDPEYTLYTACNGKQCLEIVEKEPIDLILLDIMMPVMDGIETLSKIRESHNMPIILLTAKSEDSDKVLGLNVGADDYITKPFSPLEVNARVHSQLRRYLHLGSNVKSQDIYVIGGIELDDARKEVCVDGKPVNLTPKEYEILKYLMANPDKVFSPKELYRAIWKESPFGAENTVAVHIRHLREKIEIDPAEPRYIKVIFGQGYKIERGRER